MRVKVRNNNVERAIRVFKKKSNEIIFEYRNREYYEKPSIVRHKAKQAAQKREQKRRKDNELKRDKF